MPQEAWILKCYSCKKFQVQLKKKAKKWKCSVCGAKQDLMTIYFTGQPKDCRINVQNMNLAEGEKLEKLQEEYINNENQRMCHINSDAVYDMPHCQLSHLEEDEFPDEVLAEMDLNIKTDNRDTQEFESIEQNRESYDEPYCKLTHEEDEFPDEVLAEMDLDIQTDNRQTQEFKNIEPNQVNYKEVDELQQFVDPRDGFNLSFQQNIFHDSSQKLIHSTSCTENKINENITANIFESNCEIDESLDF